MAFPAEKLWTEKQTQKCRCLNLILRKRTAKDRTHKGRVDEWEKHNRGKMSLADKEIKAERD